MSLCAPSKAFVVWPIFLLVVRQWLDSCWRCPNDLPFVGDFDGDLGWVTWDPEIVDPFIPADLNHADEPPVVAEGFSTVNESVSDFLARMRSQPDSANVRAMQQVLLANIRDDSVVGMYSNFHENAIYHLGHDDPETVRLAYM